jgi:CBS domain-containing protein
MRSIDASIEGEGGGQVAARGSTRHRSFVECERWPTLRSRCDGRIDRCGGDSDDNQSNGAEGHLVPKGGCVMKVSQVMSRVVEICSPDDNLATVACRMWDRDIGCVPIVNADGKVVGMITDRDICMSALTQGRPLHQITASVAMSKEVVSCAPDDSLIAATESMRAGQVRRLPVIDSEGSLAGMVSLNDLAREADKEVGHKSKDLSAQEVNASLAAIGHPRQEPARTEKRRPTA